MASPCPAPAFHENFSYEKPLTPPPHRLKKKSPARVGVLSAPGLRRPRLPPPITPQEAFYGSSYSTRQFLPSLFELARSSGRIHPHVRIQPGDRILYRQGRQEISLPGDAPGS